MPQRPPRPAAVLAGPRRSSLYCHPDSPTVGWFLVRRLTAVPFLHGDSCPRTPRLPALPTGADPVEVGAGQHSTEWSSSFHRGPRRTATCDPGHPLLSQPSSLYNMCLTPPTSFRHPSRTVISSEPCVPPPLLMPSTSSSTSPTEQLSQLCIQNMPPTTRLQSRQQEALGSGSESGSSLAEGDSSSENRHPSFPSKLRYSLENLDEDTQNHINKAMADPSQLVLQQCQARGPYMIFRVSELVEHTIQTGSAGSGYPFPTCTCKERSPCRHILWLFDQITRQVLDDLGKPLTMNHHGYSDELGDPENGENPYHMIARFHLDVLAHSLHTCVKTPGSSSEDRLNPRRVQEVREMLASLTDTPVDTYRPDLFDNPREGRRVVKRNDLECTIFRMLCQNNEFFHYFLSSMRTDELVHNPFRRLQQRAEFVLAQFDAYARNPTAYSSLTHPCDVEWCATHLCLVAQHVRSTITSHASKPWEYREAACTLVMVLCAAVDRHQDLPPERSLYHKLIYDINYSFVIDILDENIPPPAIKPLVSSIEDVLGSMHRLGAPDRCKAKLEALCGRAREARNPVPSSGTKRHGGSDDRKAKRMR